MSLFDNNNNSGLFGPKNPQASGSTASNPVLGSLFGAKTGTTTSGLFGNKTEVSSSLPTGSLFAPVASN